MPLFDETEIKVPDFISIAWTRLEFSVPRSYDGLLLPESLPLEQKIILMERLRQHGIAQNSGIAVLDSFSDCKDLIMDRRPDPTPDQWLWLYTQIGERHRLLPVDQVFSIMSGRDALLPFLETVPDKKIWDSCGSSAAIQDEPLPYPGIEEAIQSDAISKVRIYRVMCRTVTTDQILTRAMFLEKVGIMSDLMRNMSSDQRIRTLIEAHTRWKDPLPLFQKVMTEFTDEIAAWRDPWGNGFVWYLFRRPVLLKELIEFLPDEFDESAKTKNRYGISPEMLWPYYCPRL